MYQKMGLVKAFKTDNPDIGRAAVTGKDFDKYVFKVPTLRNIELTYHTSMTGLYGICKKQWK